MTDDEPESIEDIGTKLDPDDAAELADQADEVAEQLGYAFGLLTEGLREDDTLTLAASSEMKSALAKFDQLTTDLGIALWNAIDADDIPEEILGEFPEPPEEDD